MSEKNQSFQDSNQRNSQKNNQKNSMDSVREAQKLYKNLRRKRFPTILAALICAVVVGLGTWGWTHSDGLGGGQTQHTFRTEEQLADHFERHGIEMGYEDEEAYVAGANRVIDSKDVLHKLEAEDGDDVYYLEDTNEFVVVSPEGYIRTYFEPDDGLAYYERQ